MSIDTASNLDTEKFRKVHAMMTGGATPGERAAAEARAKAMASKAGMTLAQAVSKLDATPAAKPASFFDGFDDWMEGREPGYKAKQAAHRAERDAERAKGRADAINLYGSEKAVFQRTQREEALFGATDGTCDCMHRVWTGDDGEEHPFLESVDGCGAGGYIWETSKLSDRFIAAVSSAYPLPDRLHGVLEEWREWRRLEDTRALFCEPGEWVHYIEVQARIAVLEDLLNARPVATWEDMDARMQWWMVRIDREYAPTPDEERQLHARISNDLQILRESSCTVAQPVTIHRTNAEKRASVIEALKSTPGQSDREIGRRVGVSPQTVNTWRKQVGLRRANSLTRG